MGIKKYGYAGLFLFAVFFTGCSVENSGVKTSDIKKETLGLKPEFHYEVPVESPNILVSQSGYEKDSKKIVIFRGENLPEQFHVIDSQSGKSVYTGEIMDQSYDQLIGEYNSYGDLEDLSEEGTYYIEADGIGRSYTFRIDEKIFAPVFQEASKRYYYNRCGMTLVTELAGEAAHSACHTKSSTFREGNQTADVTGGWHIEASGGKNVVKGSQVIANLLLAYELYPSAFTDDVGIPESGNKIPDVLDEIKYEIDWLLKMQDVKTGGVYSEVSGTDQLRQETMIEPVSLEATAAFAAVMAKFSYFYQTYDEVFATKCLRAADQAWSFLEKARSEKEIGQRFFAAAELYRATGYRKFDLAVKEYLSSETKYDLMDDQVMLGLVTYISTKQKVDLELCQTIMKQLMSQAEQISKTSKSSQYLTNGDGTPEGNELILKQMVRLAVVDHVISNHEYETVIENHFYFLAGRNPLAINYTGYLDSETGKEGRLPIPEERIMNRFDLNSELIMILSEILAVEE